MKKVLASILMFAMVCVLSLSTVGCGKKDEPKKDAPVVTKDAPAKDAPAKDAPAKDTPAKDAKPPKS